ncbi:M50 family metallopeptidase [Litorimonas sp.]|uniref:M50 family metallopeptidase n=1 Tax=Litorimonas sp. TaxID=1892381 RepID=UPI003A848A5D
MISRKALLLRLALICSLYFGLLYFGGIWGWRLLYPIRLFVTFLHEFGHAFGALISGGSVEYIRINPDSGGATVTRGGSQALIISGGYLGSVFFGNILVFIGAAKPKWVKPTLGVIMTILAFSGLIWFNSVFTFLTLAAFAAFLYFAGFKTRYGRDCLLVLGVLSLLYILQDTAHGPSSDLQAFEMEIGLFPAGVWMILWLSLALILAAVNLKVLMRSPRPPERN